MLQYKIAATENKSLTYSNSSEMSNEKLRELEECITIRSYLNAAPTSAKADLCYWSPSYFMHSRDYYVWVPPKVEKEKSWAQVKKAACNLTAVSMKIDHEPQSTKLKLISRDTTLSVETTGEKEKLHKNNIMHQKHISVRENPLDGIWFSPSTFTRAGVRLCSSQRLKSSTPASVPLRPQGLWSTALVYPLPRSQGITQRFLNNDPEYSVTCFR